MGLDIRIPIGGLFALLGLLLSIYGLSSDASQYQRSLGININLEWGLVLLLFGADVLALARMRRSRNRA
jgi:hypothetical protein